MSPNPVLVGITALATNRTTTLTRLPLTNITLYGFFFVDVHSSSPVPTLGLECNYMLDWQVVNISQLELAR